MENEVYEEEKKQKIEKFKSKEQSQKILKYLKQGMTCFEIFSMPDIELKKSTIEAYKGKCIEYNLITEDEIKESRKQRKIENLKQNEQIKKILAYRKQNLSSYEIANMPDITVSQGTVMNYLKKCVEYGIILERDINGEEVRKEREKFEKNEQVQKFLEYFRQGKSCSEILEMSDMTVSRCTIFSWRKRAISYGLIDEKEIAEKSKNKKKEDFISNEQVQKIIAYKKQGLSDKDIAAMPDITVSFSTVVNYKNKSMDYGLITKEDVEKTGKSKGKESVGKGKKKNKKEKIEEFKSNKQVQRIITYKRQGLSDKKIADMSDITVSAPTVASYINKSIEYGLITKEEIEEVKRKRKEEKEAARRKQGEEKGLARRKRDKEKELARRKRDKEKEVARRKQEEKELVRRKQEEEREAARRKQEEEKELERRKKEEKAKIEKQHEAEKLERLLSYLILGYSDEIIKKEMKINDQTYDELVDELISEGRIIKEEIEQYQIKAEQEKENKVFRGLREGLSEKEISEKMEIPLTDVSVYINKLVEKQKITVIDITKWKIEKRRKEIVLKGLKEGKSEAEIYRSILSLGKIDIGMMQEYKEMLVEEGSITQYEINRNRELMIKKETEIEQRRGIRTTQKEQEKENKAEETADKRLRKLKREIDVDIKINKEPSKSKKEKIREYIETFYEINKDKPISKSDLLFLKKAMKKIDISYNDIVRYTKNCIDLKEYNAAIEVYNMILNGKATLSAEETKKLNVLTDMLKKAYAVQKVQFAMNRGNRNTVTLAEITGLSSEEINFLKIKLLKQKVKISGVKRREQILQMLLRGEDSDKIQEKLQMSELEMEDIKNQKEYRKIEYKKRDAQAQIKQNSTIRVEILFTKLGQSVEKIASILKLEPDKVQKDIELALQVGLIKENQLKGIDLLKLPRLALEQLEL